MEELLITFIQSITDAQWRMLTAFVGGLIPALIWLFFWLREDDCTNHDHTSYVCEPEPRPMLLFTFITGMLTVPLALLIERAVYPYVAGIVLVATWSFIEEGLKFLGYLFINIKSKFINEPSDPALYMLTVGLGFAAAENAFFLYQSLSTGASWDTILGGQTLRFLGASLLHVGASGVIGICLGLAFFHSRITRIMAGIIGLALATFLHTIFNHLVIFSEHTNILRVFTFVWVLALGLIILFERVKELHPRKNM